MTLPDTGATSGDDLAVPDAPAIPGFRFRRYRGRADHPGMVRANMAARIHEGILEPVTVAGMDNQYATFATSDPFRDAIIAELNGEIVGYGRVEWADNTDGSRDYPTLCLIDPAVRRRGIGRAMLRWLEGRALAIAAGQATDRPRHHASALYDTDVGGDALLRSEGYEAIRRGAEMVRPDLDAIPDVAPPDGLVLRPGSAEQSRAVWDADVEIFRDHWGAVDESPEGYRRFVESPAFDPSLWVVAWDGDAIAGIVLASLHRESPPGGVLGYLDGVGVRRAWRRRGLGRAIVAESLRVLRDRGATNAGLGVDLQNQNEAARLYESLGFRILTTSTEYRKPMVRPGPDSRPGG